MVKWDGMIGMNLPTPHSNNEEGRWRVEESHPCLLREGLREPTSSL